MTHIEEAKSAALLLAGTDTAHPAYDKFALTGILHALLALHEQAEAKPAPKRPATPKESK